MESFIPILVCLLIVTAVISNLFWRRDRSRTLLEKWAYENRFKILASESRNFFRGPFFMRSTEGQTVYYVTVSDYQGKIRSAWVRCGGWWAGLLSDKVDVKWEN